MNDEDLNRLFENFNENRERRIRLTESIRRHIREFEATVRPIGETRAIEEAVRNWTYTPSEAIGSWIFTPIRKDETMNEDINLDEEEIDNNKEEILAKIQLKEEGNSVFMTILRQYRYSFEQNVYIGEDNEDGDEIYIQIGSCDHIQYERGENNYYIYLKGERDKRQKRVTLEIPKDDFEFMWEHIKHLFIVVEEEKEEEIKDGMDFSFNGKPTDEELDEMISKVDLDTFTAIIKSRLYAEMDVAGKLHLGEFNREWAKSYLRRWAESKYRLYKILGNNLIVEQEVEVKLDDNELVRKFRALREDFPLYMPIIECIPRTWIENDEVKEIQYTCYGNDRNLKNGMKLTKLMSLYGNKELDIAISKLYQNRNKCKINLSINPIDYLTVSVNNSGWHSCHHFFDGSYKNACLSYMFDFNSFVAYSSTDEITYNHNVKFKWNSKSWRQMVFSSPNSSTTVFSRQYPNISEEKSKIVRKMFRDLYCNYYQCPNKWKVFKGCYDTEVNNDFTNLYNDTKYNYPIKTIRNKIDKKFLQEDVIEISSQVLRFNSDDELGGNTKLWLNK